MIITLRQQRLRSRLRWAKRALFVLSTVLLGYVALVFVQAEISQFKADRHLAPYISPASPHAARQTSYPPAEGDILGRIKIPRLGVSAVILEGTESRTLHRGVGHIRGSAIPGKQGNTAIAGHRDIFFRSLKGIQADDEIQLETREGSTRYLVDWARVVPPEDISVLDSTSESALTLVTCYPFYFIGAAPKRFVVRARRIPTATLEHTQVEVPIRGAGPVTPLPGEMQ